MLAEFRAEADLKALAVRDDPGPWIVADEICARSEHDAAEAFARATPRVDVVGVRLASARGLALAALSRLDEGSAAWLAAGEVAERIGWLARAARAYCEAGLAAYRRSSFAAARAAWERRLAVSKRRSDLSGVGESWNDLGLARYGLGQYREALAAYERTRAAADEAVDERIAIAALSNTGRVHAALGNDAKALSILQLARAAKESVGDRAGAARTLGAATAPASAQAAVRSREKWRHPCFWAAWQLWGLAE